MSFSLTLAINHMCIKLLLAALINLIYCVNAVESRDIPIVAKVLTMSLKIHMHRLRFLGEMASRVALLSQVKRIATW